MAALALKSANGIPTSFRPIVLLAPTFIQYSTTLNTNSKSLIKSEKLYD